MKAVIMAGGEGTRLRAVSGDLPKPLVPLCGKPVMEHIICLLRDNGITDICAALRYRPQDITDFFGDGSRLGVKMQYRVETEALGTAGGVKNCADFYGDEDFLVISGDAACDFDLRALIAAHERRGPAVSLLLYRHPEPLRYGLCLCDKDSRVCSFIEKPDWGRVVTDLVNTGIYIVSPAAMELVPEGEKYDFAKDLFPLLLDRGETLLGLAAEGYWCDIGTPLSYYECCADAICGRLKLEMAEGFALPEPAAPKESDKSFMHEESFPCRDRARLMDALCRSFIGLGAEYGDGFMLRIEDHELSVCPVPDTAALLVRSNASDAETAAELCGFCGSLLRELEKRLDK